MADPKGFLTTPRETPRRRPVEERRSGLERGLRPRRPAADHQQAGRPLHGLRHPVLPQRLPAGQPHPRVERPTPTASDWTAADRAAARHQQLPGVHRAAVPGAVRVRVRARHQPARRSPSRTSRSRSSTRPGTTGDVTPQPPGAAVRQDGRRRRLRPGRSGRRPAAHPGRPHRRRLRAGRPDRRPAAVRHPRVQDGEAAHRPPHRADARRGHQVPYRRARSAPTSTATKLAPALRRGRHRGRRHRGARPAGRRAAS